MNKPLIYLLVLISTLTACNSNSKQTAENNLKTSKAIDTINLWVDSSAFVVVNEERKSFENNYEFPRFNLSAYNEDAIINGLLNNTVSFAVLHRKLSEKEIEYLSKKESFTPKQYEFAYDAYVFLSSNKNLKSISMAEIEQYFKGANSNFNIGLENSQAQSKTFLKNQFNLNSKELGKLFAASSLNDLIQKTKQSDNVLAIIPFSYISDVESDSIANLIKGLKVLPVSYKDSKGKIQSVFPSQETITTKDYPLISPLVLLNCNMKEKSGTNFVNFLFKQKAQKVILHSGLVPAIFPGREILIKN